MDPRHYGTVGRLPGVSASPAADARVVRDAHGLKEDDMAVSSLADLTRYRWSSDDHADRFSVENPATGKVITVVQGGGAAQMNAAVESAHQAFIRDWRWRDRTERAGLLLSCAAVLEAHADELADLLSLENGKPVADARENDVRFLIGVFRFFGSIVDKLPSGDFHDTGSIYSATVLEPFGGCRRNHPVQLAAHPHGREDRACSGSRKYGRVETERSCAPH